MSWISGNCQGDRKWECTYMAWDTEDTWCVDSDDRCPSWNDGGALWHEAPTGGSWI
jgi:hypothetical protein